jgi:hypothetical protein
MLLRLSGDPVDDPDDEVDEFTLRFLRQDTLPERERSEIDEAVEGVVGMIRFGTGTSPRLFFALGDLLAARGDKHLAARAYVRALDLNHPRPDEVREAFDHVVEVIPGTPDLDEVRADLRDDQQAAAAWVDLFQQYEDGRVRRGDDPNAVGFYDAFYAEHGEARTELGFAISDYTPRNPKHTIALLIAGICLILVTAWRVFREPRHDPRKSRQPTAF